MWNHAAAMLDIQAMTDLKSPEFQAMSDDDIKKIVMNGKGKMRPVTTVTGPALDNVVAYVRGLKK
jgi:hypothetical protein